MTTGEAEGIAKSMTSKASQRSAGERREFYRKMHLVAIGRPKPAAADGPPLASGIASQLVSSGSSWGGGGGSSVALGRHTHVNTTMWATRQQAEYGMKTGSIVVCWLAAPPPNGPFNLGSGRAKVEVCFLWFLARRRESCWLCARFQGSAGPNATWKHAGWRWKQETGPDKTAGHPGRTGVEEGGGGLGVAAGPESSVGTKWASRGRFR